MDKTELGSKTAKGGFANEKAICKKFNAWKNDKEAQEWLKIMGYDIKKLDSVKTIQVPTRIKKSDLSKFEVKEEEYEKFVRFKKADAQIRIIIGFAEKLLTIWLLITYIVFFALKCKEICIFVKKILHLW